MMENKDKGFTLIELLIIIAIISILSAIALVNYSKIKQVVYKNAVRTDLKNSLTMIIGFNTTYGGWPSSGICGPGPKTCNLSDGTHSLVNGINVSRDVIISWSITYNACPDKSDRLLIIGKHSKVNNWSATFDSCNNKFSGF